jgi:hypothetical protein
VETMSSLPSQMGPSPPAFILELHCIICGWAVCLFGIGYTEILSGVWIVVKAINECPQFKIAYPASLEEQRTQLDLRRLAHHVSGAVQVHMMGFWFGC